MRVLLLAAAMLSVAALSAVADPVRVGMVLTLSGPAAALGQHARDGFLLAIKQAGGKIGPSSVVVDLVDDERLPAKAVEAVQSLVQQKPIAVIAPLFSDLIVPALKVLPATTAMISLHAGPASLAGKRCQANFFSLAPQDDQAIEVVTKFAEERNLRRAIIVSTAGEEAEIAATAFRRAFKGEVADRLIIDPEAQDFSDALNRIDILKPQALFLHVAGAAGARFVAALHRSGAGSGPVVLGSSGFDQANIAILGVAAKGAYSASAWAQGLSDPLSAAFETAFQAEYGYTPGALALYGYDAAHLIGRALELTNGNVADQTLFFEALRQADIESPRGRFSFGNNNFPIQDLYLTRVEQQAGGQVQVVAVNKVFAQYGDHYAAECPLK